jgi:hypothetical protein
MQVLTTAVATTFLATSLVQASPASVQTRTKVATVKFASDSSALTGSAKSSIKRLAKTSKDVDYFIVTGYVQNSGADLNNTWLSLRRAKMVRGFMRKSGITAPIEVRAGGIPRKNGKSANARRVTIEAVTTKTPAAQKISPSPSPTSSTPGSVQIISDQPILDAGNQDPQNPILQAIWNEHGIPSCGMGGCEHSMYLTSTNQSITFPSADWDVTIQNNTNYVAVVMLNNTTVCPRDNNSPNLYLCEHVNNGDVITVTRGDLITYTISGFLSLDMSSSDCTHFGVTRLVLGGDNFPTSGYAHAVNSYCGFDWSFDQFPSNSYSAQLMLTCSAPYDCRDVRVDSAPWTISNATANSLTLTANNDILVAGMNSTNNNIDLIALPPPP